MSHDPKRCPNPQCSRELRHYPSQAAYFCPDCHFIWPASYVRRYPGMFHKEPFASLPGQHPDSGFEAQDLPGVSR
jgi:hypothetical protein